jgi:tetratricopeptide (TPR) repeat protein
MSRFGNLEFGPRAEHQARTEPVLSDEALQLREADAAFRRGAFEQALRAFARALEHNPANPVAWSGQVRMLIELGEYTEANLWADKGLEQFPHEADLLAAKAVALARRGDSRAALSFSDAAIEGENPTPYVWLSRGDVLLARAEKRAEYCFTKALAVAPRDWLWPWLASRIHFFYRKFSLAMKLVSQALALDSAQAVLWLHMGRCQLGLGLAAAAAESIAQAHDLDPQCPEAAQALAEQLNCGWWRRLAGCWHRWRRTGS